MMSLNSTIPKGKKPLEDWIAFLSLFTKLWWQAALQKHEHRQIMLDSLNGHAVYSIIIYAILYYNMSEVKNYNKKVAVVTGSSRGNGKAITIEFAKAVYSVVINARNEEELKNAAEDISKTVGRSITNDKLFKVAGDVSQEQACRSLIQENVKRFGRIDVLVKNAGIRDESKRISNNFCCLG